MNAANLTVVTALAGLAIGVFVDRGVTAPVLTLPEALLLSNARPDRGLRANICVLINGEIDPDFRVVPDRTVDIAGQTVSTMIKNRIRAMMSAMSAVSWRVSKNSAGKLVIASLLRRHW